MCLPALLRRIMWRRQAGIVLYHSISPEAFDAHLAVLTRNYRIIPLRDLVDALEHDTWDRIPDKAMVITFDDGMRDFYQLREVLGRWQVPVTHYVTSGILGTYRHLWYTETGSAELAERLKRVPDDKRLVYLAEHCDFAPGKDYEDRQGLSLAELDELAELGIDIGGHTATHPILPRCSDAVAEAEIAESKRELEAKTGTEVTHFSYPNGNYAPRDEEMVRRAGYRSARTVERGLNNRNTDPYRLRIVDVLEDRSAAQLELIEVRLLWYRIRRLFGLGRPTGRCSE